MKTKVSVKSLIFALVLSSSVFAGFGAGNGGGAVECVYEDGTSVMQMADLYEGRLRYSHKHLEFNLTSKEIIDFAIEKLLIKDPAFALQVYNAVEEFYKKKTVIRSSKLFSTKDYDFILMEDHCRYLQLATWDESSGKVFVNQSIYEKLSNKGKAALALHEAIYKVNRTKKGHKNSNKTRFLNSKLLSNLSLGEPFFSTVMPEV